MYASDLQDVEGANASSPRGPAIVTTGKLNWLLGKQGRDKSEKICVWQILPVSPFVSLFSNSGSLYTGSLLPSPSFPVSSDENPALVNPRLCFRPPPYFPFFSCSYNLIYYFAKRHVFFSSATIIMYVLYFLMLPRSFTAENVW